MIQRLTRGPFGSRAKIRRPRIARKCLMGAYSPQRGRPTPSGNLAGDKLLDVEAVSALVAYIRTGIFCGRDAQASVLGRYLEEELQRFSHCRPERHGRCAVHRAVGTDTSVRDGVHVLHAFQKKSKSGIATPRPDVDLIKRRFKAVLARLRASGRLQ
jgi:hypothetical protein